MSYKTLRNSNFLFSRFHFIASGLGYFGPTGLSAWLAFTTFCSLANAFQIPTNPAENLPESSVLVQMVLEKKDGSNPTLIGNGNLGLIPAGNKVTVKLEVSNPLDEDIPIDGIRMSCSCTELNFPDKLFKARSVTAGHITYYSPLFSRKGNLAFSLIADNAQQSPIVILRFTGQLAGVIDLGESTRVFEVSESYQEFEIPFYFSEPILADQLAVRVSDELRDVVASIEPTSIVVSEIGDTKNENTKNGNAIIRLRIAKTQLNGSGISGEIQVVHEPTNNHAEILVTFTPRLPFRLSPTFLAFKKRDDKASPLLASAILQVRETSEGNEKIPGEALPRKTKAHNETESHFSVTAKLSDQEINVRATKMASGIYRLHFELPAAPSHIDENRDSITKPIIQCSIVYREQRFEFPISFFIER